MSSYLCCYSGNRRRLRAKYLIEQFDHRCVTKMKVETKKDVLEGIAKLLSNGVITGEESSWIDNKQVNAFNS